MKRTRFFLLIALIAMNLSATAQTAAQVLGSLTFDSPKALYHPKGNSANMRQAPSTKARKVAVYNSYDQGWWLPNAQIVADEGDNTEWVKANVEGKNRIHEQVGDDKGGAGAVHGEQMSEHAIRMDDNR